MTWRTLTSVATLLIAMYPYLARAEAQNVYRCGNSYSTEPCAGGSRVPVDDPRSPAQQAAARAKIRQQQQQGQAMEKARLAKEAAATRQQATAARAHTTPSAAPATPTASAPHTKRKAHREPPYFTARTPLPPKSPHPATSRAQAPASAP